MGRYKAKRIIIKVFPELILVFWDNKSIYAYSDNNSIVYHNWYAPRGTYSNNWLPFKKSIMRRRYLTQELCFELAHEYEVPYKLAKRYPVINGKAIDLQYKRWSIKGIVDVVQK